MRVAIIGAALAALLAQRGEKLAGETKPHFSSPCRPTDSYTDFQVANLKGFTSANASSAVVALRDHAHLQVVPDSAIVVVSDSTKCARALTALIAEVDVPSPPPTQVYLIRAGALYVASNPDIHPGRNWTEQIVMDRTFTVVGMYLR
jgi:hypothetical protein